MKIAVASEQQNVATHFGHCENFNIFDVENGKIVKSEIVANPGHKPGFLPVFLNEIGVKVVISGGMGAGAIDIFNEKYIKVVGADEGKECVEELLDQEFDYIFFTGSIKVADR